MKKLIKFSIASLGCVLVLASCQNVNMYDMMVTPDAVDITYDPFTFDFDAGPTPIRIAVSAGHDWFVESTADWISIDNVTSTGFTVILDGNYIGEGPDMRSGVVLVSSQIGQWPVVINQDRIQYSTPEEWNGTYRVQYSAYKEDPVGARGVPLVAQDISFDFLVDAEYNATWNTFNIDSFFPHEATRYIQWTSFPFVSTFNVEKGCMVTSYSPGYNFSAIFCHHYPENSGFYNLTGTKYTIDPVTKQLTLPNELNDHKIYIQMCIYGSIFMAEYYYGDFTITQIEQKLPSQAPESGHQSVQGDIKLKDGDIFDRDSDFLPLD